MKRAPASVIAPFEYTAVVWSFLLGYLIWHDLPRNEVFVGAALIVGAGLIIVASEHFRRPRNPFRVGKNIRKNRSRHGTNPGAGRFDAARVVPTPRRTPPIRALLEAGRKAGFSFG